MKYNIGETYKNMCHIVERVHMLRALSPSTPFFITADKPGPRTPRYVWMAFKNPPLCVQAELSGLSFKDALLGGKVRAAPAEQLQPDVAGLAEAITPTLVCLTCSTTLV